MVVVGNGVLYVLWIPASAGMTLAGGNDGLFAGNRTGRHSRGRGCFGGRNVHPRDLE